MPLAQLRRCDAEGRDQTSLHECLKVYLPPPAGRFGMVFVLVVEDRLPRLRCIAFGVRHHPRSSKAATVYEIAHRRLQEIVAADLRESEQTSGEPEQGAS